MNKGEMKLVSFFIRMIEKQMRKGKDYEFDFNDPKAIEDFREMIAKMFSKMKVVRGIKLEQLQIGSIPAEKHTLKNLSQ